MKRSVTLGVLSRRRVIALANEYRMYDENPSTQGQYAVLGIAILSDIWDRSKLGQRARFSRSGNEWGSCKL